jgi:hypothetical protein
MAGDKILSREDILWGLERIREGLASTGASGTVKIIGGSAMILGGHADRAATVDIDAVVLIPRESIVEIATAVAHERGWPENWINLEAQGLYPAYAGLPLWNPRPDLSDDALTVEVATRGALLAMKLNASRRGREDDDIRALMTACGVATVAEADRHFSEYFRGESMPDKAVILLRRLGFPDGDDAMYRHIPHSAPLNARGPDQA